MSITVSWDAYIVVASSQTKVDYVARNTNYSLYIRLINQPSGTVCTSCATELSNTGGTPIVTWDSAALSSIATLPNSSLSSNYKGASLNLNYWTFGLYVGASSGMFPFEVDGTSYTRRLTNAGLDVGTFAVSTGWVSDVMASTVADSTTSQSSTAASSAYTIGSVPGMSTIWVGSLNNGAGSSTTRLLLSNNYFLSWTSLSISPSFSDVDRCGTGGAYFRGGAAFADAILLNTINGVVGASSTYSSTSFNWQPVLPNCISKLLFPQQKVINAQDVRCTRAIALGAVGDAGKAWLIQGSGGLNTTELKDANGLSLPSFNGVVGTTFKSAALSTINCGAVKLLALVGSQYQIVSFQTSWTTIFTFPTAITTSLGYYTMIPSGASYSAPLLTLTLTDMSFHQSPGNDLFIWGNSLFYSPDGGATMLVVYILTAPATITYFTSSPDGTFAFLTSDNQEFFGNLGTKSIFPITTTRTPSAGSVYFPYFDRSNTFKELTLTQTGNTFTTSSTTLDVSSVLDYNQLKTSATCPYSRMLFVYTSDAVTVQNQDSGLLVSESLPNSIYLDYKKSYTFSVRMTPTTPASSGTLQLGFYLSNNDAIGISWTRNVVANWEIQYDITLTDLGAQGQTYPGTNLKGTALRITPIGSNFGCKNFVGRSWKTKVTQSIVVYSGCPPNQAMKFDWSSSTATQSCPNANSSLPCLFYDEVFPLKFSILNQITNTLSQYTGTYTLQVIGGGPSLTTISNYTNTQITSVNPGGNTLIWSDSSANQITWVCQPTSPCQGIVPSAGSSTPDYCLTFKITTASPTFTTDAQGSYCLLETNFNVRLYGLPVSLVASVAVVFGCMAFFVIVVLVFGVYVPWVREEGVFWRWEGRRGRGKRVSPVVDGGSDETLLPVYEGGGEVGKESGGTLDGGEEGTVKKKVRLGGYDGPVKEGSVRMVKGRRGTVVGGGGFFGGLLRKRKNTAKVHVDRDVVGDDAALKNKFAGAPHTIRASVATQKTGGGSESYPSTRRQTTIQALKDTERDALMEEHLHESMELLAAIRDVKAGKHEHGSGVNQEEDEGEKENRFE